MNSMPDRTAPSASPSRYRAPALEKGLDILELLANRPDGLSQSEIARQLNRSVGEIFRMLNCLVERGYVSIQRPSDRYVLTLKLFELAHRHPPMDRLLAEALPLMKELVQQVHQSCHLTVIEAGHGVVVAQVDSPGHIGFSVRVGSVMPLLSTASGRVLLAFQSVDDRERVLARESPGGKIPPSALALLESIRARGFEEMDSTRTRGVHDISYPVLDHKGCAAAAMTMPCIERLDVPELSASSAVRSALARATSRLSLAIGGKLPASEPANARAPRPR